MILRLTISWNKNKHLKCNMNHVFILRHNDTNPIVHNIIRMVYFSLIPQNLLMISSWCDGHGRLDLQLFWAFFFTSYAIVVHLHHNEELSITSVNCWYFQKQENCNRITLLTFLWLHFLFSVFFSINSALPKIW